MQRCSQPRAVLGQRSRRGGGLDPVEEGEAGALCVSAVCLQDGGLRRHDLLQPPLLAVRRRACPSFGGDAPVLCCCAWHRAHGQDLERAVDSAGACSGPSALRRPEAWPRGQTLPVSPLPLQAQAFSALWRGQLRGLAQANLSPDPGGVSSSGGGARPPAKETESEEPKRGTLRTQAVVKGRAGRWAGAGHGAPPHCPGVCRASGGSLGQSGGLLHSTSLAPGGDCVPGEQV